MAGPAIRRAHFQGQITLTNANTNYNISTLIDAIIAAEATWDGSAVAARSARVLILQAHPGIDGAGANTNDILMGDGSLSATRYGQVISKGATVTFQSNEDNVDVGSLYVRSAGAGQKLNVFLSNG